MSEESIIYAHTTCSHGFVDGLLYYCGPEKGTWSKRLSQVHVFNSKEDAEEILKTSLRGTQVNSYVHVLELDKKKYFEALLKGT